jgi:hypothetical protein
MCFQWFTAKVAAVTRALAKPLSQCETGVSTEDFLLLSYPRIHKSGLILSCLSNDATKDFFEGTKPGRELARISANLSWLGSRRLAIP